jgi:hypothetical protein
MKATQNDLGTPAERARALCRELEHRPEERPCPCCQKIIRNEDMMIQRLEERIALEIALSQV